MRDGEMHAKGKMGEETMKAMMDVDALRMSAAKTVVARVDAETEGAMAAVADAMTECVWSD